MVSSTTKRWHYVISICFGYFCLCVFVLFGIVHHKRCIFNLAEHWIIQTDIPYFHKFQKIIDRSLKQKCSTPTEILVSTHTHTNTNEKNILILFLNKCEKKITHKQKKITNKSIIFFYIEFQDVFLNYRKFMYEKPKQNWHCMRYHDFTSTLDSIRKCM